MTVPQLFVKLKKTFMSSDNLSNFDKNDLFKQSQNIMWLTFSFHFLSKMSSDADFLYGFYYDYFYHPEETERLAIEKFLRVLQDVSINLRQAKSELERVISKKKDAYKRNSENLNRPK